MVCSWSNKGRIVLQFSLFSSVDCGACISFLLFLFGVRIGIRYNLWSSVSKLYLVDKKKNLSRIAIPSRMSNICVYCVIVKFMIVNFLKHSVGWRLTWKHWIREYYKQQVRIHCTWKLKFLICKELFLSSLWKTVVGS